MEEEGGPGIGKHKSSPQRQSPKQIIESGEQELHKTTTLQVQEGENQIEL